MEVAEFRLEEGGNPATANLYRQGFAISQTLLTTSKILRRRNVRVVNRHTRNLPLIKSSFK